MTCTKIISYTVPMFGNAHAIPYGVMEVLHLDRRYTVKFDKLDAEGFNYVTIGRKQYRFHNVGSLYAPKFEFLDSKAGKVCAKQTMTLSIPQSAVVEYDTMQSKLNLIVPVGTAVPMTIKDGESEGGVEPFEAGVLACQKEKPVSTETYVAIYCQAAVRDAQICVGDPYGDDVVVNDSAWQDCDSAEVYIGIFTGASKEEIITEVAAQKGCSKSAIRLIPLKETEKKDIELDYLCDFAEEADFDCEALPAEQLRALWTAYCFHNNLNIDTLNYDNTLKKVWTQLKDKESYSWEGFIEFANFMAYNLC